MRLSVITAVTAAFAIACTTPGAPPPAPTPVRHRTDGPSTALQLFYEVLSPYGEWWADPTWGWVWTPDVAVGGWRPYVEGRWVSTSAGLTFESDVPWGWAVYHYGRWIDSPWGYSWVPGSLWSPGFTAWRTGDGVVGWAPLGPTESAEGMPWTFVATGDLFGPAIAGAAIGADQTTALVTSTALLPAPLTVSSWAKLAERKVPRLTPLVVVAHPDHLKSAIAAVQPPELRRFAGDLLGKRAALDPADEAPPRVRRLVRGGRPPHPVARLEQAAPGH